MADIKFSTGLVTYSLNGAYDVTFNPTDSAFVEKLYDTFNALDTMQDAYKSEIEGVKDNTKIFDIAHNRDMEMREMIDGIFDGAPVCEAVFGHMNVYALADGLPVWANLLLAIMDEIDTSFTMEQKKTNPRVDTYLKKYKRK